MKLNLSTLSTLRFFAFLEGMSFLVLLGIAMPLKYMYNQPEAVRIVGMFHGVLFILYVINLFAVHKNLEWEIGQTFKAFIAAFIPFGTFYANKKWFNTVS